MGGARKNTLVIDFSVLPVRPDVGKVKQFLESEIKLQYSDVKSIQLHNTRNCVLIEMLSADIVSRYQTEHNWKRTMHCANNDFRIPVYADCEAVTVRVHDLSPSICHSTITDFMLKFGEVISIREETWKHYFPGIANGVRILRMNLLQHIPSFITISNETTMVTYPNQPKSCLKCDQPAHRGAKCRDTGNETPSTNPLKPSDKLFTKADFPPMNNELQTTSPSPNEPITEDQRKEKEDEWTDIDENTSSSSAEYNEVTHKRRRPKRKEDSATKKVCGDQCSPNTGHNDRVVNEARKERFILMKNKSGTGYTRNW